MRPRIHFSSRQPVAIGFRLLSACGILLLLTASSTGQELPEPDEPSREFSAADVTAASQFGQTLGIADWLGPLAPVALSPFFGITCLSGMALYGQGWVSADNPFLGEGSPLHNPNVFYAFLVLTLITSIPRLTKVSKPFAQAVDQVEAWAGIITLLTLKMMMGADAPATEQLPVVQLGFVSFTLDTLLMIAAAINIFVINAVKFFFEVLIWITPIPTVDAIFELANKSVCAVLMAIYGYSPTLATIINLTMFVVAAFLFRWVYRREVFFRTVLLDAVWSFLAPQKGVRKPELIVFPAAAFGPFPARTRCRLSRTENGWTLVQQRLLRKDVLLELSSTDCDIELVSGYFTNSVRLVGRQPVEMTFSRRYNACLQELAAAIGAKVEEPAANTERARDVLRAEMG
ncbi:MAG: hypothetical protein R3C59_08710 [Planctomycetaceae bacterium]